MGCLLARFADVLYRLPFVLRCLPKPFCPWRSIREPMSCAAQGCKEKPLYEVTLTCGDVVLLVHLCTRDYLDFRTVTEHHGVADSKDKLIKNVSPFKVGLGDGKAHNSLK